MTMVKDLTIEELQNVIKTTVEETMQEFMEEVFASNNQNYLASIEEARADYQAGRVTSFEEAFRV
jgi:DNA-binding phage protein